MNEETKRENISGSDWRDVKKESEGEREFDKNLCGESYTYVKKESASNKERKR